MLHAISRGIEFRSYEVCTNQNLLIKLPLGQNSHFKEDMGSEESNKCVTPEAAGVVGLLRVEGYVFPYPR